MCSTFIQLAFQFAEIYDFTEIKGLLGKIFWYFWTDRVAVRPKILAWTHLAVGFGCFAYAALWSGVAVRAAPDFSAFAAFVSSAHCDVGFRK